ncbi:MAG: radical SAM protein [Chitinispirillaceae bacterium]|nr:radical SAM protein [Chitinispirillaceae bacterium]
MQPKTSVTFDKDHFNRIKRTIRNMAVSKRASALNNFAVFYTPDEVGIQLTNKCNLRCATCFQWNEDGFFNGYSLDEKKEEISLELIKKILDETHEQKSNLYLWGGEPFSYGQWDKLTDLLCDDPRWTVLCTNGVAIRKNIDSILRISKSLALLVSLDGFEEENDSIRGKGVYKKVIDAIDLIVGLKKEGKYLGEISVNCVITEPMIGKLHDFALMMEQKGINTLYICFPWYLPAETSLRMDEFYRENFSWIKSIDDGAPPSWHSYKFRIDRTRYEELKKDVEAINAREWKMRLRFQPALENDEIEDFLDGKEMAAQHRTKCASLFNRMNVVPDGKVTVCKMYPEFEVGDLSVDSVVDIWNGEKINKVRSILNNQLMPVCSKCILLYLHGV